MKQWILGKKIPDNREHVLWNVVGSSVYALSSMILTYLTIRIIGAEEGGIFAIGLTLAQMFVYIAYYEMRNFQVTDAENKYTFNDYHTLKIVLCVVMMVVCFIYGWIKNYDIHKLVVVLLVCFYRMIDGYADVYEAQFHAKERLDLAGKSMTFRTIFSVAVYFGILSMTKDLTIALISANVCGVIGVCIFNIWILPSFGSMKMSDNKAHLKGIIIDCFPLFIGMFLWTYLLSASRMAVDNVMTSTDQSYYQVLFLPVSVINLFAGFLIRPSLLVLTEHHAKGNQKAFWGIIMKIFLLMVIISLVCMVGAYLVGIPVLQLLAGCDLSQYRMLFVFLICAGGFNSIAYILYYVLTIFRNRGAIVCGYGIAASIALLISNDMTRQFGLWGAAGSYLISILVLMFIFMGWLLWISRNDKRLKKD